MFDVNGVAVLDAPPPIPPTILARWMGVEDHILDGDQRVNEGWFVHPGLFSRVWGPRAPLVYDPSLEADPEARGFVDLHTTYILDALGPQADLTPWTSYRRPDKDSLDQEGSHVDNGQWVRTFRRLRGPGTPLFGPNPGHELSPEERAQRRIELPYDVIVVTTQGGREKLFDVPGMLHASHANPSGEYRSLWVTDFRPRSPAVLFAYMCHLWGTENATGTLLYYAEHWPQDYRARAQKGLLRPRSMRRK
jgi:hypothetical protein